MSQRIGTCEGCSARYKIPPTFSGTRAKCKKCDGVVSIPPLEEPEPEPAPEPEPEAAAASERSRSRRLSTSSRSAWAWTARCLRCPRRRSARRRAAASSSSSE